MNLSTCTLLTINKNVTRSPVEIQGKYYYPIQSNPIQSTFVNAINLVAYSEALARNTGANPFS